MKHAVFNQTIILTLACLLVLGLGTHQATGFTPHTDPVQWANAVSGATLVREDFEGFPDGLVTNHLDASWGSIDSPPGGIIIRSGNDPITEGKWLSAGGRVDFSPSNPEAIVGFSFVYSVAPSSNQNLQLEIVGGSFGDPEGEKIIIAKPGEFGFFGVVFDQQETFETFNLTNFGGAANYDNVDVAIATRGTIKGKITDRNSGRPLRGLVIGVKLPFPPSDIETTFSTSDGTYEISGIEFGNWLVLAVVRGYELGVKRITLDPRGVEIVDFALQRKTERVSVPSKYRDIINAAQEAVGAAPRQPNPARHKVTTTWARVKTQR